MNAIASVPVPQTRTAMEMIDACLDRLDPGGASFSNPELCEAARVELVADSDFKDALVQDAALINRLIQGRQTQRETAKRKRAEAEAVLRRLELRESDPALVSPYRNGTIALVLNQAPARAPATTANSTTADEAPKDPWAGWRLRVPGDDVYQSLPTMTKGQLLRLALQREDTAMTYLRPAKFLRTLANLLPDDKTMVKDILTPAEVTRLYQEATR